MLGTHHWLRFRPKTRTPSPSPRRSQNYYEILQVPENSTQSQLEAAFYERSSEIRKWRNGSTRSSDSSSDEGGGSGFGVARITIIELGEAYRGLNDERERRVYDERMGLGRWNMWVSERVRERRERDRMGTICDTEEVSSEGEASSDGDGNREAEKGYEMIHLPKNNIDLAQRLETQRHSLALEVQKWDATRRTVVPEMLAQSAQMWRVIRQAVFSEMLVQEAERKQEMIHLAFEAKTTPIKPLEKLMKTATLKAETRNRNMRRVLIRTAKRHKIEQEITPTLQTSDNAIAPVKELVTMVHILRTSNETAKRMKRAHDKEEILKMKQRGWAKWEMSQSAQEAAQIQKSHSYDGDPMDYEMEENDNEVRELEKEIEDDEKQIRAKKVRCDYLRRKVEKRMKLREKRKKRDQRWTRNVRRPKIWVQQVMERSAEQLMDLWVEGKGRYRF